MGSFQDSVPLESIADMSAPLTRDACHAYIDRATFRLRPPEYCEKYPRWPGSVGLEIEMLPVFRPQTPGGVPGMVPLQGETGSSASILRKFAAKNSLRIDEAGDDEGHQLLLYVHLDSGDNISFEPGGQVEFSSIPYPCLADAVRRMKSVQAQLDQAFGAQGIDFVQLGINPWHSLDELSLQMRKARYKAMSDFYTRIGPYGPRMMRQTCTVQVNLDFGPDETTLARRYLASMLVAPIAAASFACSPVVDRKAPSKGNEVVGFRSRVWRHVSPGHTGLPGLERVAREQTREACIETYLDFAMNAPVVFVTEANFKVPETPISFSQWLTNPIDGVRPTLEDFKTHLTLLFAEVRPRGFLELRSVDCQPRAFQAVPAAYWAGLLYDEKTTDRLIDLLLPYQPAMNELLVQSERGLHHPELASLARSVMDLASDGFANLPSCFKAEDGARDLSVFREHFTARGRTPADDLVETIEASGSSYLTFEALKELEERWSKLAR